MSKLLQTVFVLMVTATLAYGQFATNYISWNTPAGGILYAGFSLTDFTATSPLYNSESWYLVDMNGDGKPDLVITDSLNASANGAEFGYGSSPHWKVYLSTGASFSSTLTIWNTPAGGYAGMGYCYTGFTATNANYGSESWSLFDINGDGKPDLVVTDSVTSSGNLAQFGYGSNPHWKVFLNTGTGFSSTATVWNTPVGGYPSRGYYYSGYTASSSDVGSQSWYLLDVNGDGKPDLVLTDSIKASGGGTMQYGYGSNPQWVVYLNNGAGFSASRTIWVTPVGGQAGLGFPTITYSAITLDDVGNQSWTVMDMNGDGKPDLVVTDSVNAARDQVQYGYGSNPYWKVYFNSGAGFATTPAVWGTPEGGTPYEGFELTNFSATDADLGSQSWAVIDMNGDGKPDLVITDTVNPQRYVLQYGYSTNPYWQVYYNNGAGFSTTSTTWGTPEGGIPGEGFGLTSFTTNDDGIGSQSWVVIDMNGDGKPDLVITDTVTASRDVLQYGYGSNPYWMVYMNDNTTGIPAGMNLTPTCKLYPNPNNGNFILQFTDDVERVVEFYDVTGRLIVQPVTIKNQQQFNMGGLNPGIYLLRITQNSEVTTLKFVVNR